MPKSSLLSLLSASSLLISTDAFTGVHPLSPSTFVTSASSIGSTKPLSFQGASDQKKRCAPLSVSIVDGLNEISALSSSGIILSKVEDTGEVVKAVLIVLLFGGGLIPASIAANKSMIATLSGGKKEQNVGDPKTSLDPTAAIAKTYIESSGASGPELPNSALVFANEKIPLADVIAIVGRMANVDSVADWKNLPSTKLDKISDTSNPPMWLPRATFKANIRAAKFGSWPVDPETGLPVGGEELVKAEGPRIKKNGALIGDAALDAVFDTWAWGAGIATPDKVAAQLKDWRKGDTLDVGKFAFAAIRGRATTGFAALTFVVIQVVAYGTLFIAPALRVFFDIDIGFGSLGGCGEDGCISLF